MPQGESNSIETTNTKWKYIVHEIKQFLKLKLQTQLYTNLMLTFIWTKTNTVLKVLKLKLQTNLYTKINIKI